MIGDRKWFRRVAIYDERFRLAIAALGAHASQAQSKPYCALSHARRWALVWRPVLPSALPPRSVTGRVRSHSAARTM